jgi:two-component system, cell cycle response regulator
MDDNNKEKELSPFQIRNIQLLTHLYQHEAITDDIVDSLRQSELDYFSLMDKYKLLEKKINVDEKTNLLKFKNDYLTYIIKTASRIYYGMQDKKYNISFIRFDIDDFSIFNNKYGHEVGDNVLIGIANIIRENSRPTDYVIRFGGEEFDVILPSTDISGAMVYLNKVFDRIRTLQIDYDGEKLKITVSAGVSHLIYAFKKDCHLVDTEIEKYYKDLQKKADNALYEAKYLGKDRYCIYSDSKKYKYSKMRKLYSKK